MVITGKQICWTAAALAVLCLLGVGLWWFLKPTEEKLIRRQFAAFTELVQKKGKEGALPAIGKAKDLSALFAEQSTFSIDGLDWIAGPYSREALSSNIFRSRALFDRLKLSFDDLEIEVNADSKTAVVFMSAVLDGTLKDGRGVHEIRELESNLRKDGSQWRFEKFRIREIIQK